MQETVSRPAQPSMLRALISLITLYVLLPAGILLVLFFTWNIKTQHTAVLHDADAYYGDMAAVCERHIETISNITTILQDSSAIRDTLNALNLSSDTAVPEKTAISDVIASPITYKNCFNNFSISAVGIYFEDNLIFYTIPSAGIDLSLDRTQNVYHSVKDIEYPAGRFVSGPAEQSAYAYYVQDYMNIYNGRYYGKIIIEVAPIPSNLPQTGAGYLPASSYSLDLQAHPSMRYYLYNKDEVIVFSNNPSAVGQSIIGLVPDIAAHSASGASALAHDSILYHKQLDSSELMLYAFAAQKDFSSGEPAPAIPVVIAAFLLYILILFFAVRNLYNPFKQLSAYCRGAAQYDRFFPPMFEPHYQEIGEVSALFKRNAEQIAKLEEQNHQAELERQENQIQRLQTQMSPHFLFNMLDIIGWKAEQGSSQDIRSMIDQLGELLRYEINQDQAKIPLRQEISYVREYLNLQQHGKTHTFEYTINADDELLDNYYIPRLVLQPLAENAIVHGILPSSRPGHIQIDIWEDMKGIMCRVKDNGVGFDASTVLGAAAAPSGQHNRIALKNIFKRLNMIYGEPYGLTINSTPGAGTVALVYIPFDLIPPKGENDAV